MCGRYSQLRSWSDLVRLYNITANQTPLNLPPRYNIAPTQDVPVVRSTREGGGRELALLRWGLVPFWAKDIAGGYKMINARAETIDEKPAFRDAFQQRRCLVVADGFYEWTKTPNRPEAAVFHHRRGRSAICLRGPLGKLEQSRWRKDRELHDCRHQGERHASADS
jgi:putative SOS response-associated peptidase YedK